MNVHHSYNDSDGCLGIKKIEYFTILGDSWLKSAQKRPSKSKPSLIVPVVVLIYSDNISSNLANCSAVTGSGIKELTELLWQKVKELKSLS